MGQENQFCSIFLNVSNKKDNDTREGGVTKDAGRAQKVK